VSVFGESGSSLSGDVLRIILNYLSIWDVLRVSQVCFAWNVWCTNDGWWSTRMKNDLNISGGSLKMYREVAISESYPIRLRGFKLEGQFSDDNAGTGMFRVWRAGGRIPADCKTGTWQNWLNHLRRRGFQPAQCPVAIGIDNSSRYYVKEERYTLAGVLFASYQQDPVRGYDVYLVPASGTPNISFCSQCFQFYDHSTNSGNCRFHPSDRTTKSSAYRRNHSCCGKPVSNSSDVNGCATRRHVSAGVSFNPGSKFALTSVTTALGPLYLGQAKKSYFVTELPVLNIDERNPLSGIFEMKKKAELTAELNAKKKNAKLK
jgi:hypothetical protein